MFVDDDVLLPPDHISKVQCMLQETEADAIGGPFRSAADDHGPRTCGPHSLAAASVQCDDAGTAGRLLGGNMTIRRSAFERRGLFDERLSGRGDETEWFMRPGGLFLYSNHLAVIHRRDHMTAWDYVKTQFRQGRSLPAFNVLLGKKWRPNGRLMAASLVHAARFRCTYGLGVVGQQLGGSWALVRRSADR
jgi:GT2 family glycosyltransferase